MKDQETKPEDVKSSAAEFEDLVRSSIYGEAQDTEKTPDGDESEETR